MNDAQVNNEVSLISWRGRIARALLMLVCGMAASSMFPPLGWSAAGFVGLVPLIYLSLHVRVRTAAGFGLFWGMGWIVCSFWWLREIDGVIPFLLAPVLGVWQLALFAAAIPLFYRAVVLPYSVDAAGDQARRTFTATAAWREVVFAGMLAGWMVVLEYSRSSALPWNYLSASQYRNTPLLQLAAYTGSYGISFLLLFTNAAVALAIQTIRHYRITRRYKRPAVLFSALVLLMACVASGAHRIVTLAKLPDAERLVAFGVIQGDVSQRRNADETSAQEALDIYLNLTETFLQRNAVDLIIWPETAIPYPFRGNNPISLRYRAGVFNIVRRHHAAMLIGTLDFEVLRPGEKRQQGMTNSALLIDKTGSFGGRFDKIIRVPFGEYVPLRKYLPEWLVRRIDMNRDLVPGQDATPLNVAPGVRAGLAVCFEDVFPELARREALLGANMLMVISNDAWYPESSEPVQHLANAVMRAVETQLPMLRAGNSSTSCVITPYGGISAMLKGKADTRSRHAGILALRVREKNEPTFYTRHGNWFVMVSFLAALGGFAAAAVRMYRLRQALYQVLTANQESDGKGGAL